MFSRSNKNNVPLLVMEQLKDVESCLINFESFMMAASTPETVPETLRSLAGSVMQAEAAADISLRRMIDSLAGSSLLPATREDIISVVTSCDRIANKCEALSNMIVLHRFRFPAEYAEDYKQILSITHEQFDILEKCISTLFGRFGDLLKDHAILDEIREHESRVDKIEQKLCEQIFARDEELAYRMQLSDFTEMICDISDIIENISDKIQIMLITRKA